MKKSSKVKLFSIITILIVHLPLIQNVQAFSISNPIYVSYVIEDTHVDSYYPDRNNGDNHFLEIGYFGHPAEYISEAYLKFDVTNKPETFNKVELTLLKDYMECWDCDFPILVEVSKTDNSWSEDTMNWTNRPSSGEFIGYMAIIPGYNGFILDLTDYFKFNQQDTILSIIFHPVNPLISSKGFFQSKEYNLTHPYTLPYKPRITWSMEDYITPIFITSGIIAGIVVLVSVSVLIYKKKKRS